MKRFTALMTAALMLVALAACGKKETAPTELYVPPTYYQDNSAEKAAAAAEKLDHSKKAAAYLESILGEADLEKYSRSFNEMDASVHYAWDTEKSPRPEQRMPVDITVDGLRVTYGDPVSVLLDEGYQLDGADKEVPAGFERSLFSCENEAAGRKLQLKLANFTDENRPAKECSITGIMFSAGVKGVEYKGLTEGSTVGDAIRILGIPSDFIEVSYSGVGAGTAPQITLDYGYGAVSLTMKFTYHPELNTTELNYLFFS